MNDSWDEEHGLRTQVRTAAKLLKAAIEELDRAGLQTAAAHAQLALDTISPMQPVAWDWLAAHPVVDSRSGIVDGPGIALG